MSNELLQDMLYFCLIAGMVLIALLVSAQISIARLKHKNYFLNRDRERYAETLYASKDGYFAFIYPDEKVRDPRRGIRERCSRRLAVMLNLKEGTQASFSDVLGAFYKADAQKINKYVNLMKEEGIGFEEIFSLKGNGRSISVSGARINGQDGNLYCDMIWFRDLSEEVRKNCELKTEKEQLNERVLLLEKMLDSLDCPVWLRDESLKIVAANRSYLEFTGSSPATGVYSEIASVDICGSNTAKSAVRFNKMQKNSINLVNKGKAYSFELIETPCRLKEGLEKNGTVGRLEDRSELEETKRDFKIHQTAHLEVLSALGTAFAIFNNQRKLIFYNKAFLHLWNLSPVFLEAAPSYGVFLDEIRNLRLLPEVCDYKTYKSGEEEMFSNLITSQENLLHIPDGRTFKRMVSPYPNGLIFAYEDVSDRLAATRMINELVSVQQNVLEQVRDAIIIFDSDQNLRCCNNSYRKLWNITQVQMQKMSDIDEFLEQQKTYLNVAAPWEDVKQSMMRHIITMHVPFAVERQDGVVLEATPVLLPDDSVMIKYVAV